MIDTRVDSAIILAGGKGERLRPLTQDRPKCMVEVAGAPLLALQMTWLKSYGVRRVVIACGYHHEVIQSFFGNGSQWGMDITYAVEREPLGRGGGLKSAMRSMGDLRLPVLALNGDNISSVPIIELENFHRTCGALATIVTVPLRSPYGIVETADNGAVTGFREKPELSHQINAGIYLLDPSIIGLLPDVGDHEVDTFPALSEQGRLFSYRSRAFWRTVDTMKDLGELEQEVRRQQLPSLFTTTPVFQNAAIY